MRVTILRYFPFEPSHPRIWGLMLAVGKFRIFDWNQVVAVDRPGPGDWVGANDLLDSEHVLLLLLPVAVCAPGAILVVLEDSQRIRRKYDSVLIG